MKLLHRVYWCVERWPNYDAWRPLHSFLKEWMGEDKVYYGLVGMPVTRRERERIVEERRLIEGGVVG